MTMLRFMKQVFIILLSFAELFTTKYLFLNNQPCITRSPVIGLSPNE